jgi:hypothetical protein
LLPEEQKAQTQGEETRERALFEVFLLFLHQSLEDRLGRVFVAGAYEDKTDG